MPLSVTHCLLLAVLAEPPGDGEAGREGAGVVLAPGEVELSGTQWRALRPDPEPEPGAMVLRRDVWLRRVPGGVELRARWQLRSERAEWFGNGLLGPSAHLRRATWNGREAAVWSGGQGPMVVERLDGEATLEVEAFLPGDPSEGLPVTLLGAPRGTARLEGFDADVGLGGDARPVLEHGGVLSTGAAELRLHGKPVQPRDRGPLVVAHVGLGLTVGDAEVRGRARVRWEIRQGTRRSLSLSAIGVGEDLTVEGPQVAAWQREGERLRVELSGETAGLVDLDLRWTVATPPGAEASVSVPTVVPQDVFRSPAAVQVARDGEVDVRPRLHRSWRAVPSTMVPAWAEGLVDGTPTAAFLRARAAEAGDDALELLRLEPVPGPPVVVDVADLRVAATEQGRVLLRARYEVRNERASHLVVTPPPGMELLGVEVAGRRVVPARAGEGGAVRIPLKRSLETVGGLVTVPVTVALLGVTGEAWERRERRELPLPVVDAPVSVERVTLHLPPRYRSKLKAGEGGVVEAFDRGQEVGFGLHDARAVAQADRAFAEAVEAWNANEFEAAQAKLDALSGMGARGANTDGLQANVDLVRPRAVAKPAVIDFDQDVALDAQLDSGEVAFADERAAPAPASAPPMTSSALERRIRARARARAGGKKVQLEGRKAKAKQLKDEGRYQEAAAEYREALEESADLRRLEDEESVVYDFEAEALEQELREVEARTGTAEELGSARGPEPEPAPEPAPKSVARQVQDVVDEDGEKDFVGGALGLWTVVMRRDSAAGDDAVTVPAVEAEPAAPWGVGPLVEVPEIGEPVRHQHLLLEAGEPRTVRVDARRLGWR